MKHAVISFFLLIAFYLLQTTIFSRLDIAGIKPDIILILLVFIAYRYGRVPGMFMGFFTGLLLDFTEGNYLGYYALLYLVVGYLLGFCNKLYNNDSILVPLGLVALSDFFLNFLIFITGFLLRNRLDLPFYMMRIILPELIYTVIVSILIYRLVDRLFMRIDKVKTEEEV